MKTGQGVSLTGFILTSWSGGFMVSALASGSSGPGLSPGAHFSKALETFRARKTILDLSVHDVNIQRCARLNILL